MKRILSFLLALLLAVSPMTVMAEAERVNTSVFILPTSLETVEESAFAGNAAISTLFIPKSVKAIGSKAFDSCKNITEVSIGSDDVVIADDAFVNCSEDIVFYAHDNSKAMTWALTHGYVCESLDGESDRVAAFEELVAYSGFDPSMLMSSTYACKCLIVRVHTQNKLPDISAYHPIDVYRSDSNLFYIQFETEDDTEDCFKALVHDASVLNVEVDSIGESDVVDAQGVTLAENWGTNDVMGFDVYAPFVAERASGTVTIAVVDSGVSAGVWAGPVSAKGTSLVGGSVTTDTVRHGSKIASIISDCMGENVSRTTLLPVKIVNNDAMYRTSVIIEGIKHAAQNGADIINLSLGWDKSKGESPEIRKQIELARSRGIMVVGAAGNGYGRVMFPGNCDGVITVSALSYDSTGYYVASRTGSEVNFTAPGIYLGTAAYPNVDLGGDIMGTSSTSFAAPQIAAALALIKLDSTRSDALSELSGCSSSLGLSGSEVGRGLPDLTKLAIVNPYKIDLKNAEGGEIPVKLWVGNDFMLNWEIQPANTTDKTVTVESSNPTVLAVRQYTNGTAIITAKKAGQATVTVSCGEVSSEFTIHVEQPVTGIDITGAAETLFMGKTMQLNAVISPASADNKEYTWKSSNPKVATVSEDGLVTPVKAGSVIISCIAADGYGTVGTKTINVEDIPDAQSITLEVVGKDVSSGTMSVEVGEKLTLLPTILPENAPQDVQYTVFPAGSVEISGNVLTAKAPGTATIIATASTGKNVTAYLMVTVEVSAIVVTVSVAKNPLDVGETTLVQATVLPSDATNKTVTWSSSDKTVATVSSSGKVTAVAPGQTIISAKTVNGKKGSVTITVRQPITLTFDANKGTCSTESMTAYVDYEVGTLPTPTRNYWIFQGWYTAKSGGTKVTKTSVLAEDTVLYAHWKGENYPITFDANGGTADETERTGVVGTKLGALPTVTRSYYTFQGWFTSKDGGEQVTSEYVQNNTAALTLYAHWENNPYTMTFNANGGTCTEKTKTGYVDTAIGTLPTPTRSYYTFDGWYTAETGGTKITASYVRTTAKALTVHAHWTPMPYTVTFDANGGKCDVASATGTVDTEIGTLPTPTRAYYTFLGWETAATGGIPVSETYVHTTTDELTLYAQWARKTFVMTFEPGIGTCDVATKTFGLGKEVGTLPTPSKTGYTFNGWFATDGTEVTSAYKHTVEENITVTARWTANNYTITFNPGIGTCDTAAKTGTVDVKIGTLPTPSKSYYTFNGWFTATSGGTQITADYVQADDSNITLYAQWTPGTYTAYFDANGGSSAFSTKTGTVDVKLGTLPGATKSYYILEGWYTAQTGGTLVNSAYVNSTTNDVTFYAHWTPMEYSMKFDANGGTTPTSIMTGKVDTAIGTLPNPTRTGYSFTGWYKDDGTLVNSDYKHPNTDTITVVAHWDPINITYNVVYQSSNGTQLDKSQITKAYAASYTISPDKTFTGYTTPPAQTVAWDSTAAKTITFTYTPVSVSMSPNATSGTWWNYSSTTWIKYSTSVELRNRTATSIELRFVWTNTISKGAYYGYQQHFTAKAGGVDYGSTQIITSSTWSQANRGSAPQASKTVYSSWKTVPVSATTSSLYVNGTYYDANYNKTWSGTITIPTF